ncbi:ROK family transcriptional regulator [Janthinobacterium agaricidamnosum]|uniref:ROK family protein n=1 Tax=Janthinobacterium agaricidamnosum NBRC 102515 = DSM 9628 TaxID=1349767 RepID=W0V6M4_9BURK|nr:ROK family transcriptional regulator [Janthinobacterium agaricidamnosum]CDG84464.1 ROK family protein [Janthinobacterium agaricidamnosum NBRC 102515 = DSM 9628]
MNIGRLNLNSEAKHLLWHLRTKGPTARTELSLAMDVSNSTVTKLSHELLNLGLVEELAAPDAPRRGRPTIPLALSADGGYTVGAAVHKGMLEIAFVDFAGDLISLTSEAVVAPDPVDFARLLDQRIIDESVKHRLLGRRFLGIGIGIPGPALARDGKRWHVVKELPGWRDVPLRQILDDTLGLRVMLENDANAAALAEYYRGGPVRQTSTVVVILLGYGVGAGVIEDGRLLRGGLGGAGDIGMLYPGTQPRPTTLDLLAMLREAGCAIESVASFDQQTRGYEALIEGWLDRAAQQLETALNSAVVWFDPAEIILSGSLPFSLLTRLAARLNNGRLIVGEHRSPCSVRVSNLGRSSIALGAALLPIHALTHALSANQF